MDHPVLQGREKLFAHLAILNGFLTDQQLNSASGRETSQSLGDAFVERGVITENLRGLIDDLVDEHLKKHHGDAEESLTSLAATVSIQGDETDATHVLKRNISTPDDAGGDTEATEVLNRNLAAPDPTVSLQDAGADVTHDLKRNLAAPDATQSGYFAGYEIQGQIGKGGMGVVYKARQAKLNRIVALKMIKAGGLADEREIERFKAEAEAAANLDHPGIVPVHEVGESGGHHFFSMGFVEGDTLADRLHDGPLEPRHAAEVVRDISDAVAFAHSKQIIHRDLKPANVLIDLEGQPRITDFGLAKQMAADNELTATGQVLGTPSFMPPEQAAGGDTGPAADVYALGAILYATTTGKPPHQAANPMETLLAVLNDDPIAPRLINRQIPKDLETICLRCLNKEPAKRYASAEELADDLGRWLSNEPIKARRVGRLEKSWLWCKRRPLVAGLLAAVFLILTVGSAIVWERSNAQFSRDRVDALVKADPSQLKGYIDQIEEYEWWTKPLLEDRHTAARDDSIEKTYLELALLRFDDSYVESLQDALLVADVRNFKLIANELAPHQEKFQKRLWTALRSVDDAKKRFRAGLALANYAPYDNRWTGDDAKFLVNSLLSEIPEDQPLYREFLVGVKWRLYPELKRAFLDPDGKERRTVGAAKAFAEFSAGDIARIGDVAVEASPEQWPVLYSVLDSASPEAVLSALGPIVSWQPNESRSHLLSPLLSPSQRVPSLSPLQRVKLGQRRAGAAIALLRKGNRKEIFDVLRVTDDPESLTQFVHRLRDRGVTPAELLDCLDVADKLRQAKQGEERQIEDRVLFGILLALGEFSLQNFPDSQLLIDRLADWYATDPSSAIHGATGWLLRKWGQDDVARRVDQTPVPYSPDRQWYTLELKSKIEKVPGRIGEEVKTYMTFVVIPAGTYTIGSPENEPGREEKETRHEVTIAHPFALLDREVSWADATVYNAYQAIGMRNAVQQQSGSKFGLNEPWVVPHWYDSVMFCRWLTEQVGLGEDEQAYANPARLDPAKYPRDTDPASGGFPMDWPVDLESRGYRLLTEPEWEVACRAGTSVSWSFGSDPGMLDRYGWFMNNSKRRTHAVRVQRPNLRGIFDMHGNAMEWCNDWYAAYPGGPKVREGQRARVYRGGGWGVTAETCRSSFRFSNPPAFRLNSLGFRVATVLPSEIPEAHDVADQPRTEPSEPAPKLGIGDPSPGLLVAEWVKGDPVDPPLRDKVHVVEFWATRSGACTGEMPHISELQTVYGDEVAFIGVTREDEATVTEFLAEKSPDGRTWDRVIKYRLAIDDGWTNEAYMRAANEKRIPCAFVVGRDGVVEWLGHPGGIDEPLKQIVEGSWDRDAAIAKYKQGQSLQAASKRINRFARSGD